MRVPTVPKDTFIEGADRRWKRLPSPNGGGFELARWEAEIAGVTCRVVAYQTKQRGKARLAVQGVRPESVPALTQALYDLFVGAAGSRGVQFPRKSR